MAPLYSARCCSSHCTLSASRWLVGSSSSSRSGLDSSSLHSATRRRSPPERWVTGSSGGGQRSASIACSSWESMSHASACVELLLELAHLLHQLVGVVGGHQLGDLVVPVELGLDVADAVLDVLADGLVLVELRLLLQDADRGAGLQERVAVVGLVQPGHDPQDARLTGPVRTDDADLRAGKEVQSDVVKDDLVAVRLADLPHRVDEFGHAVVLPFRSMESWYCSRTIVGVADRPSRRASAAAPAHADSGSAFSPTASSGLVVVGCRRSRPRRPWLSPASSLVPPVCLRRSMRAMHRARSGPTAVARTSSDERRTPSRSSYSLVYTYPTTMTGSPFPSAAPTPVTSLAPAVDR